MRLKESYLLSWRESIPIQNFKELLKFYFYSADFRIPAECYFSVTSLEWSFLDGIAVTLKGLVFETQLTEGNWRSNFNCQRHSWLVINYLKELQLPFVFSKNIRKKKLCYYRISRRPILQAPKDSTIWYHVLPRRQCQNNIRYGTNRTEWQIFGPEKFSEEPERYKLEKWPI